MRRDILKAQEDYIVIPVNKVGVMGAGLAKQFAMKYPEYVEPYKEWCKNAPQTQLLVCDRFIFIPTKNHWKDMSNLMDIRSQVITMYSYYIPHHQGKSVAMPLLGAGLGGLNAGEVCKMLQKHALGARHLYDIETVIYD